MFEANYEAEEIIVLIFVIEIFLKLLALGCHLDVENLKGAIFEVADVHPGKFTF